MGDPYAANKSVNQYLNPAAFAQPAPGTLGNVRLNSVRGPGFWTIDMGLSRTVGFSGSQNVELRLETFNLLNNFNWGSPVVNFASGTFGRILTQAGTPRILQFGIKYGF
jgi:hypothetical protein